MRTPPDHYEILGIEPHAGITAIEQAYLARRRMLERSPQVDPAIRHQLRSIETAWATLSDAQARATYDAVLASQPDPNAKFEAAYARALSLVRFISFFSLVWCGFMFLDYRTIEPKLEIATKVDWSVRHDGGGKFRSGRPFNYYQTTTSGGTFSGITETTEGDTLLIWRSALLGKAVQVEQIRFIANEKSERGFVHHRWHQVDNLYENVWLLPVVLMAVSVVGLFPLPRFWKFHCGVVSGLLLVLSAILLMTT